MEEFVGGLWHRLVTGAAGGHHPGAAVSLKEMESTLGVLYRAFGGDSGLRVGGAAEAQHGGRRRWLSRLAGSGERVALASVGPDALRLPASIDRFARRELNRDLYLWLAALAGCDAAPQAAWFERNRAATRAALERFPGLAARYRRLVEAHLAERIGAESLPPAEAAQETAIRRALSDPTAEVDLPPLASAKARPPQPVPLWLAPDSGWHPSTEPAGDDSQAGGSETTASDTERQLLAERVEMPEPKSPIIFVFRAESLLSWGEYLRVNRALDDDPDPNAKDVARDMDHLSLARGGPSTRSKVRFDLDLPSAAHDDLMLGDGIPLPEWDYRSGSLLADHCRVQPMLARDAQPQPLPAHLARPARQLRQRFAALVAARRWNRAQSEGEEIDLDACVRHFAECAHAATPEAGLYQSRRPQERDLACLLLADLSMSTDTWVSDEQRVIDVIRDSALLFCEALSATGDRFGVYGFSSVRRGHVRFHVMKDFNAAYDGLARGRIAALKPGYYTRMGAAIRQSTRILAEQPAARRLLLILSDGKPNDLDLYDSRYGIEDTRMAVQEARRLGLIPYCVTIDREGGGYLPHLFGEHGFTVVSDACELPTRLPKLYARISLG